MTSKTGSQVREAAGSVADRAKDAASSVGQMAEKATSSVGSGMESLGQTMHRNAPQGGMLGSAAQGTANALQSGGRYLREEGLGGMGESLTECIRNYPVAAFLTALVGGYLLAQMTRG